MQHLTLLSALTILAVASSSTTAAPVLSRRCEVKVNEGITTAQRRCVTWVNEGITTVEQRRRDSVGIGNEAHDLTATFDGATLPSVIQGRDYSVGIGNDVSNTQLDLTGAHGDMQIIGRRSDGRVGILNGATGDYSFDDATFGDIIGTQHINRRGDGDVGVKNGATGGGDYDRTVWGPQVGDMYIGYSTTKRDDGQVGILNGASGDYSFDDASFGPIIGTQHINRRGDGDVGVKNGATGGGDYDGTVWGPQVGDMYIGYSTTKREAPLEEQPSITTPSPNLKESSPDETSSLPSKEADTAVYARDGNNDADPCPGVPVGPSVGTTYMPMHPSTNQKRCSSTPIPPTYGGVVYTDKREVSTDVEAEVEKRDGNNDADPCPGVPVGPSVGTTFMPTHPSTNQKRCSSTPIPPTDGGIVYTNKREEMSSSEAEDAEKRDGNNDADPCPGVPVGPSVGTTYMPTHPSTKQKRCSTTPIAPTSGGVMYTN